MGSLSKRGRKGCIFGASTELEAIQFLMGKYLGINTTYSASMASHSISKKDIFADEILFRQI